MPLPALFALEEECGCFDMTAALAGARGRRLEEVDAQAEATGIMQRFGDVSTKAMELISQCARDFADGHATPNEARAGDRLAAELMDTLGELRKEFAAVRAAGGLSVVGGGRG